MFIPVLRPRLPPLTSLAPYLNRIDANRAYSNFGPLVREFEARLAERYELPPHGVIGVANATAGLTAALAVQETPRGSLCVMPAWTFIASPLAAMHAGLVPHFLDVGEDWTLQPEMVEKVLDTLPTPVGAVMPVLPFGRPLDVTAWDGFRRRTGIAVVIDAAAGFDALVPSEVPSVVSLHATKALGAGEGGYVVSRDTDLIGRVQTYTAFGFNGSRDAVLPGFNAKLSEYNAALALAGLDAWEATRAALVARADAYRAAFARAERMSLQDDFGIGWIANTCVVSIPEGATTDLRDGLAAAGIDSRDWWGRGAHRHAATRHLTCEPLPLTDRLGASTIGVPFYVDMPLEYANTVVDALARNLPA